MIKIRLVVICCSLLGCIRLAAQDAFGVEYYSLNRYTEEQSMPEPEIKNLIIGDSVSFFVSLDKDLSIDEKCYSVFKDYPQEGMLTYKDYIFGEPFYYQERIPEFDWEVLEGDSVVCGYICQKAKTKFRGREWIAWYALGLPYPDGPWKLCGLPGLILKAQDVKGDYLFVAQKIGHKNVSKLKLSTKGYKRTTAKDFSLDLEHSYKDPFAFVEETKRIKTIVNIDGHAYHPTSKTACMLEYFPKEK